MWRGKDGVFQYFLEKMVHFNYNSGLNHNCVFVCFWNNFVRGPPAHHLGACSLSPPFKFPLWGTSKDSIWRSIAKQTGPSRVYCPHTGAQALRLPSQQASSPLRGTLWGLWFKESAAH